MSVSIEKISKSFKSELVLDKVSFDVQKGELFGLIGPDGAGKSTLFRIIASLLKPDNGSCSVYGSDTITHYKKVREIIGYMPGRFSLYMDLTVEENLGFYATVYGSTIGENYDLIEGVYSHIAPFRNRLARNLSGGMKQKLALSCALIHRPRLLILDEPTTGVDAVSRREFWEILKSIQKEGITILVSTPYMDEAAMCDRIALLQRGRLLNVSRPDEIFDDKQQALFSFKSDLGAYYYLSRIRSIPGCKSALLFGDELHVAFHSMEDAEEFAGAMSGWKDESIVWERITPGIEDRFIELMVHESNS